MPYTAHLPLAEQARHVIALTEKAWQVAPASPRARVRSPPNSHVGIRFAHRSQAVASPAERTMLLAHSW